MYFFLRFFLCAALSVVFSSNVLSKTVKGCYQLDVLDGFDGMALALATDPLGEKKFRYLSVDPYPENFKTQNICTWDTDKQEPLQTFYIFDAVPILGRWHPAKDKAHCFAVVLFSLKDKLALTKIYGPDGLLRSFKHEIESEFKDKESKSASSFCPVAFDSKGHVFTCPYSNVITKWSMEFGEKLLVCKGHTGIVNTLAFCPTSKFTSYLASGSSDKTVRIWESKRGTELFCLKGHSDIVRALDWAPIAKDGSLALLASGSFDGTVMIWDVEAERAIKILRHDQMINCVAWGPHGKLLAVGQTGGTLRVWNVETQTFRDINDAGCFMITWISETALVCVSDDWKVKLLTLHPEEFLEDKEN